MSPQESNVCTNGATALAVLIALISSSIKNCSTLLLKLLVGISIRFPQRTVCLFHSRLPFGDFGATSLCSVVA